ncbi:MAG TPA: HAD family hydrolase [Puia sp.]|nr:HAD family hydrolase [Puia sp.]
MKRRIAFFDFDGTISTKDTLLELIKYQKGRFLFYIGFLINVPYLIAYKLKIIPNSTAKQKVLKFFFNKTPLSFFQLQCDRFASSVLPSLIRPKALLEIKKLQKIGTDVVVVSASAKNWLLTWAEEMDVQLIATMLEVKNERLTGMIDGENCHGQEKVNRIEAAYDLSKYDEIYCYGDSPGDEPMLALGTFSFYKPFR